MSAPFTYDNVLPADPSAWAHQSVHIQLVIGAVLHARSTGGVGVLNHFRPHTTLLLLLVLVGPGDTQTHMYLV
jgi:hypothetical protein